MFDLVNQSSGKVEVSDPPIGNARSCYELLKFCDAHILYFYAHGYTRHRQADIDMDGNLDLFIHRYEELKEDSPVKSVYRLLYDSIKRGEFEVDRSWIELTYGKLYLDELYGRIQDLHSKPFVILNMCESAQLTPSLSESFIHFFLDRGARVVIGTECSMSVEFAHPFADMFLRSILAGKKAGKALLDVRRYFMGIRNPLGLAYTLFGSATANFQPPMLTEPALNENS